MKYTTEDFQRSIGEFLLRHIGNAYDTCISGGFHMDFTRGTHYLCECRGHYLHKKFSIDEELTIACIIRCLYPNFLQYDTNLATFFFIP